MSGHTPEPWVVMEHFSGGNLTQYWIISPNQHGMICRINVTDACGDVINEPTKANARLIAAAPELLAALKALADYVFREESKQNICSSTWMDARAAIAKAEGKATREQLLDELRSLCPNSWAIWTDGSCDDESDQTLAATIREIKAKAEGRVS